MKYKLVQLRNIWIFHSSIEGFPEEIVDDKGKLRIFSSIEEALVAIDKYLDTYTVEIEEMRKPDIYILPIDSAIGNDSIEDYDWSEGKCKLGEGGIPCRHCKECWKLITRQARCIVIENSVMGKFQ